MPSHPDRVAANNLSPKMQLDRLKTKIECPYREAVCEFDTCVEHDHMCMNNFLEARSNILSNRIIE